MADRKWGHMNPRQFKDIERAVEEIDGWWKAAQNCKSDRFHHVNEAGKLYDTIQQLLDLVEQTTEVVD